MCIGRECNIDSITGRDGLRSNSYCAGCGLAAICGGNGDGCSTSLNTGNDTVSNSCNGLVAGLPGDVLIGCGARSNSFSQSDSLTFFDRSSILIQGNASNRNSIGYSGILLNIEGNIIVVIAFGFREAESVIAIFVEQTVEITTAGISTDGIILYVKTVVLAGCLSRIRLCITYLSIFSVVRISSAEVVTVIGKGIELIIFTSIGSRTFRLGTCGGTDSPKDIIYNNGGICGDCDSIVIYSNLSLVNLSFILIGVNQRVIGVVATLANNDNGSCSTSVINNLVSGNLGENSTICSSVIILVFYSTIASTGVTTDAAFAALFASNDSEQLKCARAITGFIGGKLKLNRIRTSATIEVVSTTTRSR